MSDLPEIIRLPCPQCGTANWRDAATAAMETCISCATCGSLVSTDQSAYEMSTAECQDALEALQVRAEAAEAREALLELQRHEAEATLAAVRECLRDGSRFDRQAIRDALAILDGERD